MTKAEAKLAGLVRFGNTRWLVRPGTATVRGYLEHDPPAWAPKVPYGVDRHGYLVRGQVTTAGFYTGRY